MPSKADDSYRTGSRWDHLFEPTERWVFCCWPTEKPAEEAALQAFLSTKPQARPSGKGRARDSRRDLTLLIGRGPTSHGFAELTL
jgi:hypothetical protein